jgi:iron complex transport system substrate-binding protein
MRRIALIPPLLLGLVACGGGGTGSGAAGTTVVEPTTTTTVDETTTMVDRTTTTGGATTTGGGEFPVVVDAANGVVTIEQRPEGIVSLAPTATEILFAIGAGDQVVAVDELSNHPDEAPVTDLSGFEPNVEAVAGYEPDLVVVSDDLNDIVASLTAIGIPVIHVPAAVNLDDAFAQIEQIGAATGHSPEAAELVSSMQAEIQDLTGSVPATSEPLSYYHELDSSYFTVTSATFIGQIYGLANLENIADEAEGAETLYPQLSAEYIIDADPDLVFLADTKCCGESAATVAERPGWDQMTAVTSEAVFELDDDIASRWGPRVVDFVKIVVEAVSEVAPGS